MLLGLAWRNLWRYPRRTWLNVISISFAALVMVFLLSFQLGTYATMKENVLRIMDGFAQIQPTGYHEDPGLKKIIADPASVIKTAKSIPGISAAAPRAMSFVILANGEKSMGAAMMGVDPQRETQVSKLNKSIHQGRYLQTDDTNSVVLGSALARNLGVKVGDTISLLGEGLDSSIAADVLKVVGIFSTGTAEVDRQFAEMPLARFQNTFGMGRVFLFSSNDESKCLILPQCFLLLYSRTKFRGSLLLTRAAARTSMRSSARGGNSSTRV